MNQLALLLPDTRGCPSSRPCRHSPTPSWTLPGPSPSMEKAAATRRAYRSDFAIFAAWCLARSAEPLPASPAIVAAFLAAEANAGAKASTITRRAAAIRYAHRLAGHEPPTSAETVRAVMRGIRRSIGTAKDQKAPATADLIVSMLKHCPDTLAGKRDRALIALGFAGAFRRSELVALTMADLVEAPDGYRVLIRHSKTDQEGQGAEIAIPARLPAAARGGRADVAGSRRDQRWPGVPPGAEGQPHPGHGAGGPCGGRDRQALRRAGRLGSRAVCRAQPARRVPDQRGRGRRIGVQDDGGVPPQDREHAPRLCPTGRSVQGTRRGGIPVTASAAFTTP